jgi:hypothetical protein
MTREQAQQADKLIKEIDELEESINKIGYTQRLTN